MNKGSWARVFLVTLTFLLMIPNFAFGKVAYTMNKNSNKPGQDPQGVPPIFQNVSVHDPSIVKDGDTYYVFGSHIEAARSTDLMSWTRFTNGYSTPGNAIFGDLSKNLAGSFAWAGENDSDSKGGYAVWAPDVFWNKDYVNEDGSTGAYLMYYSASSTYIRSAIGFAVSKNIEGPYRYGDTLVYSGFTRDAAYDANSKINKKWTNTNIQALIDGGTLSGPNADWFNDNGSYKNSMYPNAIDANLFYDHDGKLWMVYGSWSGGIFLLEIDKATGKAIYPGQDGKTEDGRVVDRYFGTKIAGGFGKSGEGPYVVYDKETGYYYLYVTYAWLGADGGYNIRTFRSTSPSGPYVDASGQNAVLPFNTDNAPYGNKMMGNYLFERKAGDPGTGIGVGYVSPGHNSVLYDDQTGKRFLVFHTRFPQTGEYHEVRVHQLFMNKEGWPVAAPYRYAGETLDKVNTQDLVGEYKFILHPKDNAATIRNSVFIRFNKDHTISGDASGSWEKEGQNQAAIIVDGITYQGVFVRAWDPASERYVMTFTAMSSEGVPIWGSRLADKTDREIVQDVVEGLNLGDTENVVANLTLPTEGTRHTQIAWQTSDPGVVTDTGAITRPEAGSSSATAVLTATIRKGVESATKSLTITVLPVPSAQLTAHYAFEENLGDAQGTFGSGTVTGNRINNTGGTLTYTDGRSGKAAVFNGSSGIRLPNKLIASHNYSISLWVKPETLTAYTTTFFGAKDPNNWVSILPQGPVGNNTMVWSGSARWYDAPAGTTIRTGEWSHLALTVEDGAIKFYVNGALKFAGTDFPDIFSNSDASFSLGVNWWDTPFKGLMDELRIYQGILTEKEIRNQVFDPSIRVNEIQLGSQVKRLSLGNTLTPSVSMLPSFAGNRNVNWSSADPAVASVDPVTGRVKGSGVGSTTITATAADGGGATASYTIDVIEGPAAHYTFDGNLKNANSLFGAGTITGNHIDSAGGTVTFASGVSDQAAVFDGNSGVRLPNGLISGNNYSVSIWVNPAQLTTYTPAFFGAKDGNNWVSLVPQGSAGNQTMVWSGSSWYDAPTGMSIPAGEWTHLAFTVEKGSIRVYVNGAAKFAGTNFPDVFSAAGAIFGLAVNWWDTPFKGMMDDMRVYDGALSPAAVAGLAGISQP